MAQSKIDRLITQSRILLGDPYAHLNEHGEYSAAEPEDHIPVDIPRTQKLIRADRYIKQNPYAHQDELNPFQAHIKDTFKPASSNQRQNDDKIERTVETLKRLIWQDRNDIWDGTPPSEPIKFLDPEKILKKIGFEIVRCTSLGTFQYKGKSYEVSGEIDRDSNKIWLSKQEPYISRKFTLAHELGHALMHAQTGLHRDPRPQDRENFRRESIEREADKFASYLLLPEKLVRTEFKNIFMVDEFVLTDNSIYALNPSNNEKINSQIQSRRGLSRFLAQTETYNGLHFLSLSDRFGVSIEAMAIRLEELKIV